MVFCLSLLFLSLSGFIKSYKSTVLVGFNEVGFNESSRFNKSVLPLKHFLLHKKSDLTNIRV